jgi:hypothetical protein
MITLGELLMGRQTFEQLTKEQQKNVMILLHRINSVRTLYGRPMKVNDGVRRVQDTPPNGSKTSWHLKGAAIDIDDDDSGTLWKWLIQPEQLKNLKKIGLWLEHGCYTHSLGGTWVHFQIFAPTSGKRIFTPSLAPNPNPKFWDGKYDSCFD